MEVIKNQKSFLNNLGNIQPKLFRTYLNAKQKGFRIHPSYKTQDAKLLQFMNSFSIRINKLKSNKI